MAARTDPELRRAVQAKAAAAAARRPKDEHRSAGRKGYDTRLQRLADSIDPDHEMSERDRLDAAIKELNYQLADARLKATKKRLNNCNQAKPKHDH
jgi:hypothetical protein